MKRIYILGVNGNARDIMEAIFQIRLLKPDFPEVGGFLDDGLVKGTLVDDVKVCGPIDSASQIPDACFVNAIGSPESYFQKSSLIAKAGIPEASFISVIHPQTDVSPSASIGIGSVVLSHTSVGAGVRIGNHVMVLQNCVISHDTCVEDYAVLTTGVCLSGNVHVEKNAYLGSQCSIRGGVKIGPGALVGMGSVVLKNIPAREVWCGNPARRLRTAFAS